MTTSWNQQRLLHELVRYILSVHVVHPVRVAIDGVDTSGKTTLADELVEPLKAQGKSVIRASVDGFHNPRARRYAQGKDSPQGYYLDSFDNGAIVDRLLQPLGKKEPPWRYETTIFDYRTDEPKHSEPTDAVLDSILIFDGVFLLRPELNDFWDLRMFLQVPFDEVLRRAEVRDRQTMGDQVQEKYMTRYIPGQQLYLDSEHPETNADIVIDNSNFKDPRIIKSPH